MLCMGSGSVHCGRILSPAGSGLRCAPGLTNTEARRQPCLCFAVIVRSRIAALRLTEGWRRSRCPSLGKAAAGLGVAVLPGVPAPGRSPVPAAGAGGAAGRAGRLQPHHTHAGETRPAGKGSFLCMDASVSTLCMFVNYLVNVQGCTPLLVHRLLPFALLVVNPDLFFVALEMQGVYDIRNPFICHSSHVPSSGFGDAGTA